MAADLDDVVILLQSIDNRLLSLNNNNFYESISVLKRILEELNTITKKLVDIDYSIRHQ